MLLSLTFVRHFSFNSVQVSDNGGPLDHCTNGPLRGGKHTFFEGGVRVMSFVSGPLIPASRRGTRWTGMAASADWYETITVGMAGGEMPNSTGYRRPDALNLWPSILDGSAGPRTEVVHQVQNQWICDVTQPQGGCVSSMRMGEMKLIIGGPGDSRTVSVPAQCTPIPTPKPGYLAPCPAREIVSGCQFECGSKFDNCEACFGNATRPVLTTPTAAACQAACSEHNMCGAFQWIGVGTNSTPGQKHHQCIFKCAGALSGGDKCRVGLVPNEPGWSWVCGPKHNDSHAPPLPPPPSTPAPAPPCPVPFGLSGGELETGTDHARADGIDGSIHELTCDPWCLFNLTSDIGEQNDLGQNPAFQDIAKSIADRLAYHGSTGPMPAYIWNDPDEWKSKVNDLCVSSLATGCVEPLDVEMHSLV